MQQVETLSNSDLTNKSSFYWRFGHYVSETTFQNYLRQGTLG